MAQASSRARICGLFIVAFALAPAVVNAAEAPKRSRPGGPFPSYPRGVVRMIDGTPRPHSLPSPKKAVTRGPGQGRRPSLATSNGGPLRSPTSVVDEAGMLPELGGDDVVIATYPTGTGWGPLPHLQIASDGTLFLSADGKTYVDVYRSTDGGETWPLWSTFAPADFEEFGDFLVVEGDADRAFIAYESNLGGDLQLRIAYADIHAAVPTWTSYTALNPAGVTFVDGRVALASDAFAYSAYFVYLLARGDTSPGGDIWFARSTDQGASFAAGTKVAESTGLLSYDWVYLSVGAGEYVHAAYERIGDLSDYGIFYRRAASWAAGAWDPEVTLDGPDNGVTSRFTSLAASPVDGDVVMFYELDGDERYRFSTDYGSTWPGANLLYSVIQTPVASAVVFPPGTLVMGGSSEDKLSQHVFQLVGSNTGDPAALEPAESMTINPDPGLIGLKSGGIVYDASRSNRIAAAWDRPHALESEIRFDAEWRRDPGYGNTEVGFPIPVTGDAATPPAIAEIDGDPEGEIVFATVSGDVHVINHNGTEVQGWPQNLSDGIPYDAPVAIGDLTGNGEPFIVIGSNAGDVYAFDAGGNIRDGWPVAISQNPAYVSIGALGPPYRRYVVAACGTAIKILRYDGVNVAVGLNNFSEGFDRPCAIGDVDNDGIGEIVAAHGSWVHVLNKNQSSAEAYRFFGGETFSDAATLCDLDLDGNLEIAAPTAAGKMYMMHHDLTDVTGWPVTVPSAQPLTSASLADFLSSPEPEVVFAERNGSGLMHMFDYTGSEASHYPESFDPVSVYMPPIVAATDPASAANIVYATPGAMAYSYRNLGGSHVGFPRNLPGTVEETPAAGDIDNDGRNEIVILGTSFLTVLDVGQPPRTRVDGTWRMYGHDAQRTGCLACGEAVTAADDTPGIPSPDLSVFPNPFNPQTTISYAVERAGPVSLRLYDVSGRLVDTIMEGRFHQPNRYRVTYDTGLPSGVYFLKLETASGALSRKIVILK